MPLGFSGTGCLLLSARSSLIGHLPLRHHALPTTHRPGALRISAVAALLSAQVPRAGASAPSYPCSPRAVRASLATSPALWCRQVFKWRFLCLLALQPTWCLSLGLHVPTHCPLPRTSCCSCWHNLLTPPCLPACVCPRRCAWVPTGALSSPPSPRRWCCTRRRPRWPRCVLAFSCVRPAARVCSVPHQSAIGCTSMLQEIDPAFLPLSRRRGWMQQGPPPPLPSTCVQTWRC